MFILRIQWFINDAVYRCTSPIHILSSLCLDVGTQWFPKNRHPESILHPREMRRSRNSGKFSITYPTFPDDPEAFPPLVEGKRANKRAWREQRISLRQKRRRQGGETSKSLGERKRRHTSGSGIWFGINGAKRYFAGWLETRGRKKKEKEKKRKERTRHILDPCTRYHGTSRER